MILCVGTTPAVQRMMEFDRVAIDAVNRAIGVTETASGKSINVAAVTHVLGEPVLATGFLGGTSGRFIRARLEEMGIGHDFVEVAPNTRTCITVIDRRTGQATELVEEARPVEPAAYEAMLDKVRAHAPEARVAVLSGSLPPGAPENLYARCVEALSRDNIPCIVDAREEALRLAAKHGPMLVKPNRAELAATLGRAIDNDQDLREAILSLLEKGPRWAVVTMGPDGAIASDGRAFWWIRVPAVKAVSPIGSGDSFAAGLAVGIARGMDLSEASRLGAACGAANAMNALSGCVHPEQVQTLLKQIDVQPW